MIRTWLLPSSDLSQVSSAVVSCPPGRPVNKCLFQLRARVSSTSAVAVFGEELQENIFPTKRKKKDSQMASVLEYVSKKKWMKGKTDRIPLLFPLSVLLRGPLHHSGSRSSAKKQAA